MRILFAKLLVGVTGLLIVALAILFAVLRNPSDEAQVAAPAQATLTRPEPGVVPPTTADAADDGAQAANVARGRAVYVEQRCRACHSIEGEGNTRSPLDGVSGRLTEKGDTSVDCCTTRDEPGCQRSVATSFPRRISMPWWRT